VACHMPEEALRRVESLSRKEQDAIASQIKEALDDEEAWTRSFREKPAVLRTLAREAPEENRRGARRACWTNWPDEIA
jgi:hypothetical protein